MKAKLLLTTLFCLALFIGKAQTVTRTENFNNYAGSTPYAGIPVGENQISWTFAVGSQGTLNGNALILGKDGLATVNIPFGIAAATFSFYVTNENNQDCSITVSVEGVLQSTVSIPKNSTNLLRSFTITNSQTSIFTLELANTSGGNRSVTIDDVSWSGYSSIREIQYTTIPGDGTYPSPVVGNIFTVFGTVSGVNANGYYIQDADGEWNGIWVADNSIITPSILDEVVVTGTITEVGGRTEIGSVSAAIINGTGTGNAANAVLIFSEITEGYESVVGEIASSRYVENDFTGGNYTMTIGFEENEANNTLINVDNDLFTTSEPATSPRLYNVTGPVNYNGSSFSISPRDNVTDILEGLDLATLATSTMINPASAIAFNGNIVIESNEIYSLEVYNLAGQKVKAFTGNEGRIEISMEKGVYIVKLNTANASVTEKVLVK